MVKNIYPPISLTSKKEKKGELNCFPWLLFIGKIGNEIRSKKTRETFTVKKIQDVRI